MASATITNTQTEQDEHLAKFPPFKGPKTGGNFEVDENVVAGEHLRIQPATIGRTMLWPVAYFPQPSLFLGPKLSLQTRMAIRSGAALLRSYAEHRTAPRSLTFTK